MSEPKRPWFRFRLLTAVVMMLALSMVVLVWTRSAKLWHDGQKFDHGIVGWPFEAMSWGFPHDEYLPSIGDVHYSWYRVVADVIIFLLIAVAVALVSEFLLRRREGRKP